MTESASEGHLPLLELLAARARHASDGRLALDVALGVLAATAAAILRPPAWAPLLGAALCFVAFGGWGIADRLITEAQSPPQSASPRTLRIARIAAAALGAMAFVTLLLTGMALLLGPFVS